MIDNAFRGFHAAIIALALLILSGCGYKGDPVYQSNSAVSTPAQPAPTAHIDSINHPRLIPTT